MADVKPTRICSIDGCERPYQARGWCNMHYDRWHKHGDPLKIVRFSDPNEAFAARTEWQGDCLIWTGATTSTGRGSIYNGDKVISTHVFAWERINGPVPEGLILDHICHTGACCNIAHLRLATRGQNNSNLSGAHKDNKSSGVRNVKRRGNKWRVTVDKDGKRHYFGTFDTIEEAAKVAARAREELFGEFAGKG